MKIRIKIPWKKKKRVSRRSQSYREEPTEINWSGIIEFFLPFAGALLAGYIYHLMGGQFWIAAAIEFPIALVIIGMFRTSNCWGIQ